MPSNVRNWEEPLAAELAAGRNVREASAAVGINERTAYRRLTDRSFRQRVSELRGEMVSQAAGRLADTMNSAADKLRELMGNDDPIVALRAANSILANGMKVTELVDLESQVRELKEKINGVEQPGRNFGTPKGWPVN